MTDQTRDMEWRPLEQIARKWLEEAQQAVPNPTAKYPWQDLIDALPDHNQTMIDAIEAESPGLSATIDELMNCEGPDYENANLAWTALVNHIFNLAKATYEATP